MPPASLIQNSFSSGEVAPALYSRTDIAKYATSVRRCRNFIINPVGGAHNRPGTVFVAAAKYSDKKSRVVRFLFSQTEAYVFEFGDHYIRFYKDQAQISISSATAWVTSHAYVVNDYVTQSSVIYRCIIAHTSGTFATDLAAGKWVAQTIYEIYSPYTEDDLELLRFESSADVTYITHPDFQTRTLTRFGNTDWRLAIPTFNNGPFMIENITTTTLTVSAVTGTNIDLTASASLFAALHVGALFKLTHYIPTSLVSNSFSATGTSSSIKCFTTWRLISHGTWTGKFRIEKSIDGGTTWTSLREFTSSNDFNANTFGTEDIELNEVPFLIRINMYAYTSGTATIDLSADPFFQEGIVRIVSVTTDLAAKADVVQTVGSTAATDAWSEGSWSDYRGYPTVCRFFQDRLAFSSTYSEPQTTWLTEIGNYSSFFRHSPLLSTDGISANLPSRQLNAINGLIGVRKLIALTSASEWTIGATSGSALTPTTIEQLPQGYRGSFGIDPVVVGNEVIFIQANSKVVRNLAYQFGSDGYDGANLNVMAQHLFKQWTIEELAYQQDPDSVVWALRSDGILLGMTYMQEQDVVAWSWHDTGGNDAVSGGSNPRDKIESICVIPGQGFDELWMVVNRTNGRFIERMSERFISEECGGEQEIKIQNQIFLDSTVSFNNPIDIEDITVDVDNQVIVGITAHGFSTDDEIFVDCVEGTTEINNRHFAVLENTIPGNLRQVIIGGDNFNAPPSSAAVSVFSSFHYSPSQFWGNGDPIDSGTGTFQSSIFTLTGTLKNFRIHLQVAPTAGKPYTYTLFKNGSTTGIAITISNPNKDGSDLSSTISILPGDVISMKLTGNTTGTLISAIWTADFISSSSTASTHSGGVTGDFNGDNFADDVAYTLDGVLDDETDCYGSPVGGSTPSSHENRFAVIPSSGTIKNLYIVISQQPGSGKSYTFTMRKNGVETTLVVAISGTAVTGNDTTHSFSCVEGDRISWRCTPANLPHGDAFTTVLINIGFTFDSAVDGQFPVFQNTTKQNGAFAQNSTTDRFLAGYDMKNYLAVTTPFAGEITKSQLLNSCTLKKLVVRLSTAPGSSKSRKFTLYKNNSAQALDLTISGSSTTGSITTDVAFSDNDMGWTREVLTSTPADTWESISYVAETALVGGSTDADSFILKDIGGDPIDGTGFSSYVGGGHVRQTTDSISGLSHLEGQTVGILADGVPLAQQVVSGGAVTLDAQYAIVHVGLPYFSDLETLNIELPLKSGTAQGRKVKIGNVTFRLENTRGGYIGPNKDNLYNAFPDSITSKLQENPDNASLTDAQLALLMYTGDVRVPLGAGYEDGGRIFYRNYDPTPVSILAIIPEVEFGGPAG